MQQACENVTKISQGSFKVWTLTITQSQSSVSLVCIAMNMKLFIEKWNIETKNEKEFFFTFIIFL